MKRSKAVQLLLMGLAPITMVGCEQSKTEVKSVKTNDRFNKPQDCIAAGKPADVCSEAYMLALKRHKDAAPQYEKKEDCEADFMADYCVAGDDGKFMPKMGGFSLATESRQVVDRATGAPVVTQNTDSNGFITGMLLGNLMSGNGGTTYHSDPYYSRRDAQGIQSSNTLNGFASSGYTPSRSIQERARSYSNANSDTIRSARVTKNDRDDDDDSRSSSSYSGSSSSYGGSGSSYRYNTTSNKPASSSYGTESRPSNQYNSSSYNSSSSTKSYSAPSTSSYSVSSAVSRGGFGSTSSAKSSFSSSFGG